jgi:predicted transcriptional regulator of viral defense system
LNQIEALRRIRGLGVPGFETRDVAALLRVSPANASVLLSRLARGGFVRRVARGLWAADDAAGPDRLVEQLAAPYPAYVSLQSALFRRGLIEQVPSVVYAVTPGRTRRVTTPLGAVSFHRIPAALFEGFAVGDDGVKMATAEKALFDLLYLGPTRSRLFAQLPEFELPRTFRWKEVRRWLDKIPGKSRRAYVAKRLAELRS